MSTSTNPYAGYSKRVADALASFDRREQEKREQAQAETTQQKARGLHWEAAA
jgi:hypothetical protein